MKELLINTKNIFNALTIQQLVLAGGQAHGEKGWFIEPTLVQVTDPKHRLMQEEIFGPIVTVYVYEDADWSETLQIVDETGPYALTGAVFSQDRYAVQEALLASEIALETSILMINQPVQLLVSNLLEELVVLELTTKLVPRKIFCAGYPQEP